jgi:hypothetical protein
MLQEYPEKPQKKFPRTLATPLFRTFKSLSFERAHYPLPFATKLERSEPGAPFFLLFGTIRSRNYRTLLLLNFPIAVSDQFSR